MKTNSKLALKGQPKRYEEVVKTKPSRRKMRPCDYEGTLVIEWRTAEGRFSEHYPAPNMELYKKVSQFIASQKGGN